MQNIKMAALGLTFLSLVGCAMAQSPVTGFIYTDTKANSSVTDAFGGSARGEACATSILGAIGCGGASIDAKAPNDRYVAESIPEADASLATDTPSRRTCSGARRGRSGCRMGTKYSASTPFGIAATRSVAAQRRMRRASRSLTTQMLSSIDAKARWYKPQTAAVFRCFQVEG